MSEAGKLIKEFRKKHLLTLRQCEKILGLSYGRLSALEHQANCREITTWRILKAIDEYERRKDNEEV